MIRLLKISMLIVCWLGCTKSPGNTDTNTIPGYQTFTINQGEHYSKPTLAETTKKNEIRFKAIFDSSCIYHTVDTTNQRDINKLYGFSDCNTNHLENSARIGWRWYNNELQLLCFVHSNGVIQPDLLIGAVAIGSTINCRITCLPAKYQFEVNGVQAEVARPCTGRESAYKLYPYFGGDETAPHLVRVFIDEL
ncbi:MAG: hypothetical protein QM791_12320 [Ferruginibacter sp.]